MRRQARAFAADRVLDHLHDDLLALVHQFGDRRRRRGTVFTGLAEQCWDGANDVGRMQECRALQADLDERRLHSRHDPADPALVDVADVTSPQRAFDMHFLQHAVLDDRDAGLARRDIDQNFFAHGRQLPNFHKTTYSLRRSQRRAAEATLGVEHEYLADSMQAVAGDRSKPT